jgi:prepilin-type N-terminal cleavage/methylation domain-containing protein
MKTRQTGFTLVEIAIVLVIIGLLLGGILKGQEMITQAKIKNVINDFNGITAAVYSYQDRYKALPGDDLNAATRWSGGVSGDGNGVFNTVGNATTYCKYNDAPATPTGNTDECSLFWWDLRLSGFVAGTTDANATSSVQQPNNAANGITGVQTIGMGFTGNIVCSSNLPDKIAIAVDTQMDDATSSSGQIRGYLQTTPNENVPTATTGFPAYVETGTNTYLLCKSL